MATANKNAKNLTNLGEGSLTSKTIRPLFGCRQIESAWFTRIPLYCLLRKELKPTSNLPYADNEV